jgi:hypothetical protein
MSGSISKTLAGIMQMKGRRRTFALGWSKVVGRYRIDLKAMKNSSGRKRLARKRGG